MTCKENITAILECYFTGFKKEIIDSACNRILEVEPCEVAISREDAIMCMTGEYIADMTYKPEDIISKHIQRLRALPPVQPKTEIKPIGYRECSDAMLKMWMDNVLTDGEYYRIMDKLNTKWSKMNEVKS